MPWGLTSAEATARLRQDGPNCLPTAAHTRWLKLVLDVATEPMFLMLLAAGAIYVALGDPAEAMFLLGFVVMVIVLTLVQQHRTERALDALRELSAPRALVVRDGISQRIAAREVVRGDCLILSEGDRVAADAVLIEGELEADESLLSGESIPVTRRPAGDRSVPTGRVCAGTVITRGAAHAEVIATGAQTQIGRIGLSLSTTLEPRSPLQDVSRRVVRWVGLVAIGLATAQTLAAWWQGEVLLTSLLAGLALAMAILPEEIPVILTIFLALGAWRIARKQVLTRRVSAVETLGSITVLAVDKTGTLTENRMAVAALSTPQARFERANDMSPDSRFNELIESAWLACREAGFDPTERAIRELGRELITTETSIRHGNLPISEYPLTSEFPAMTRVYQTSPSGPLRFFMKGAPEAVTMLCDLEPAARATLQRDVEAMAAQGLRVLAVARGAAPSGWLPPLDQRDLRPHFVGLLGLADPPRRSVPAALERCRQAGVRVMMMTGDHALTARAIANRVGLSTRQAVLTGATLDDMSDAQLRAQLPTTDIWARLRPDHKLRLIEALRQTGEVVGMTGDGVNDAPALRAAHVGIAMGARGTDVAREAAALVLLDDSFESIVEAIAQGRHVYDNICRAIRFACAVHVPIIGLTLGATLMQWPVLLMPAQIVLLELLIDPACAIVFEAEPPDSRAMKQPPRPRDATPFGLAMWRTALLQGVCLTAVLLGAVAWLVAESWPKEAIRSTAFSSLTLSVLMLIAVNRPRDRADHETNRWAVRAAIAVPLGLAAMMSTPWLTDLMGMALLNSPILVAVLGTSAACLLSLMLIDRTAASLHR